MTEAGKVIVCSVDKDRNILGKQHNNTILDTHLYNVQFPDRSIKKLAANRITINLYASVEKYGHRYSAVRQI